jgi:hypothetical protein
MQVMIAFWQLLVDQLNLRDCMPFNGNFSRS